MRSRSADDDLVVSSGHTAAFEALCHPGGCGPDVAFAQGMREGVGRVWPMASEHVAHPYIHSHGFSVRACGLVGVEGWVVWPSSRGPRATVSLSARLRGASTRPSRRRSAEPGRSCELLATPVKHLADIFCSLECGSV